MTAIFTRYCKGCQQERPEESFYKTGKCYRSNCKRCDNLLRRHRGYGRVQNVSPARHAQLLESAQGICQLCGVEGDRLTLDHNHTTGKLRKVICYTCNNRVGVLESGRYKGGFSRSLYDSYIKEN